MIAIAGSWCPKCKEDGGMFHYASGYIDGKDSFHLCESCLCQLDNIEYEQLLKDNPKPIKNFKIFMQQQLSFEKFQNILSKIVYQNWELKAIEKEDGYLLQWVFIERDATIPSDEKLYEQHCRKWYISKYCTETEVIRTAWLAVQQAVIHEASENFLYNNIRIFDPHTNYVDLSEYMSTAKQDIRE